MAHQDESRAKGLYLSKRKAATGDLSFPCLCPLTLLQLQGCTLTVGFLTVCGFHLDGMMHLRREKGQSWVKQAGKWYY